MRSKENALDYRYFPEPDLSELVLDDEVMNKVAAFQTEIPHQIIKNLKENYEFNKEYINTLISNKITLEYFNDTLKKTNDINSNNKISNAKTIIKRISGPIAAYTKENFIEITELPFTQQQFIEFIAICLKKELLDNQLKQVIQIMLEK